MTENKSNFKVSKKWLSFASLMLGAGTIYKLYFIDGSFYVQLQEVLGLSHTQIGVLYSVSGLISTFGFIAAMFLTDRFSKKKMIPFALIGNGLAGIAMATLPSYPILIAIFCGFAVFSDMLFWPTMLKTIRLLGNEKEQGRMFGFLETGRGLIDTIVAFGALGIFAALGSSKLGFQGAILFYAGLTIIIGILAFFFLEDDAIAQVSSSSEKNRIAFKGMMDAIKDINIWIVAFNVFAVYSVYTGIKYFVPFLKDIYAMPVTLVAAYGIINSYVLKMVGGPIGGYITDKFTKSAAKFIRIMFVLTAVALGVYIILPHENMSVVFAMGFALVIASFVFCMRAVFFAPMDEIKVPREITGSAMALGSFIGYLPGAFMGTVFGSVLDANPGFTGYQYVFGIMAGLAVTGLLISSILVNVIKKKAA
jgi:sugar phosphate permease